jgi:nocturnin
LLRSCEDNTRAKGLGGGRSGSKEYSTWKFRSQGEVRRVIDYIWFSAGVLEAVSRWEALDVQEVGSQGLPCARYPSDHLAVLCTLGWSKSVS